ncbi:MAG TPA: DUF885 domain-containing protein [Bryobacteraceae bacterium]|nr:DUF885 domain-containing protein [Bryobacteraceae bacterium]
MASSVLTLPLVAANPNIELLDESFVKETLALSPTSATGQGYHQHNGINLDELLDDNSPAGRQKADALYRHYLNEVVRLTNAKDSIEDRTDLDIIRLQCEAQLLDLEHVQSYRHNPTTYVEMIGNGIYQPFVQNYAPEHTRLTQITARVEKIPAALEAAKHNLVDAPAIWVSVAAAENQGNIDLIDKDIRAKIPPDLKARYDLAAAAALSALRSFEQFLRNDLSKHPSDWRLGAQRYSEKFKLTLATGDTPDRVLHDAETQLERVREDMGRQAQKLYPRYFSNQPPSADSNTLIARVMDKVAQQHTTPDRYFDDAKRDLAAATQFVKARNLLTLPSADNLQVIPTPEFMRGIYGVGGFSPAPALEPQLGAFFWITPFTSDMTAGRVESRLREYNHWGLKLLTIHEAMPGHYVQFEYASQVKPKWRGVLRAVNSNGPYVEGWAVYVTQLFVDGGFDDTPEMHLTWGKHLLRVIANTILDIRLQTMGMTDQQALDLMINQTFQEKEEAEKKLQRAKLSSCQLPTYFVGWRGWNQVRAAYEKKLGSKFRLPEFHQRALDEGAIPLPILKTVLERSGDVD